MKTQSGRYEVRIGKNDNREEFSHLPEPIETEDGRVIFHKSGTRFHMILLDHMIPPDKAPNKPPKMRSVFTLEIGGRSTHTGIRHINYTDHMEILERTFDDEGFLTFYSSDSEEGKEVISQAVSPEVANQVKFTFIPELITKAASSWRTRGGIDYEENSPQTDQDLAAGAIGSSGKSSQTFEIMDNDDFRENWSEAEILTFYLVYEPL